ncbi:transmembrane protein 79 isoform X2 [Pogona vitticeps]
MAAVAPSEEMGMVVLRNDSFGNRAAPNYTQHSFENPEMTLPWDQGKESVMIETLEADPRPSPEGSRGETTVGPAVDDDDDEAFARFPSTVTAKEEDNDSSNRTPKVASHVFIPIDPRCIECPPTQNEHKKKQREREEEIMHCEKEKGDLEKQNFISRGYSSRFDDLPGDNGEPPKKRHAEKLPCLQNGNCSSGKLKAVASMTTAMVIFPCLLYGAYVFLPFDTPLMPTMSSRLVYTLRCGVFATFPIIVGFRRVAQGGGNPPALRLPVRPALHPVLLQHRRPLHLSAPGSPEAHPPSDSALRHFTTFLLAGLCDGPFLPRFRLWLDIPATPYHATVQPLQYVPCGFGEHVCHRRQ